MLDAPWRVPLDRDDSPHPAGRKDMFQAVWHGAVLAESDQTVKVEGNHYFPPGSLRMEYFTPSQMTSVCPWKGTASYYDITVDGSLRGAAARPVAAVGRRPRADRRLRRRAECVRVLPWRACRHRAGVRHPRGDAGGAAG